MTEARRRAIQRRSQEVSRTVEVHDSVTAGDVEGQRAVKLDALGGQISCDAGVVTVIVYEAGGSDHEPLGLPGNGDDGVRVVEGVEIECARVAADLVGLVATVGSGAEWVWYRGGAAVRAAGGGGGEVGAH